MLQIDVSIYCYLINYSCMGVFMQVELSPLFDNEDEERWSVFASVVSPWEHGRQDGGQY